MKKRGRKKKPPLTAETPLTFREQKFIDAYFMTEPPFNGAQAARAVGYSEVGAAVEAVRKLIKANVKAAIERRKEELARESQITRQEWMKLGKAITFHDPGKMYDQLGNPIEIKDLEYGERMSVEGFEFVEDFLDSKDKQGNKSKTACGYTKKFKHTDRHKWYVTMGKVCGFINDDAVETDDELKSLTVVFVNSKGQRVDPKQIEHRTTRVINPTKKTEEPDTPELKFVR